jgi:FkbM family methyltransferase
MAIESSEDKIQINFAQTGEQKVMQNLIKPGQVIFDIGANQGDWSQYILNNCQPRELHLFEPVPQTYHQLLSQIANFLNTAKICPNSWAVGREETLNTFYFYQDSPAWSTFYRRLEIEKQYHLKPPQEFPVFTTTLDAYCDRCGVEQIHYLKIDVEGGELDVLSGAKALLRRGKIDYIQFEYGGTYLDAKITLKQVFDYLHQFRYEIFQILPAGLQYKPQFQPEDENYQYSNFLAVNERFRSQIFRQPAKMLDLPRLLKANSISPRGVIHIGAYEGKEIHTYQQMGVTKVLFVEANPVVFERLKQNIAGFNNVQAVNCAISDRNGTVTLHVTSMDQSSSILPLKEHRDIYQEIQESDRITVQSKTLDNLLQELQLNPAEFNILNIDIQGAELLAFKGATHVLKYIDAINTEVNYQELYQGCALIHQLDEFLENHGFERIATTTPYHPSWGDAFYRRQPAISMSSLGKNGRFANQLFQYAFLKIYGKQHHLRVETPPWIGELLFGHQDPPLSRKFPEVREEANLWPDAKIPNSQTVYKNVHFWGYFQYHTQYYAPEKEYFRSLFEPVEPLKRQLQTGVDRLRSQGHTWVGLHLRRGDDGYEYFYVAPSEWYKDWLSGFWETLENPVLFIASDRPETVLDDFAEYHPVTSQDLGLEFPQAEFYPDFYLLSQCDAVAISNSSFSFAACMLNKRGKFFFRPHLPTQKLIAFDSWHSETIFRDAKVFNPTPAFLSWVASRIDQYHRDPSNQSALKDLQGVRQQLAEFWLTVPSDRLPHAHRSGFGQLQKMLLNSGIKDRHP